MTREILRKQSFGLGLESSRGTGASATVWIPIEKANLKHVVGKITDTNGRGIIDKVSDSHVATEASEFTAEGKARSQTIGYLLKMALGTAGSATLVETGVYTHAFTRLNSNQHPTATMYRDGTNGDERAPFHLLETLDLDVKNGEYVRFNVTTKGGKIESTSSSPSFLTGTNDEQFLATRATIKIASDISGLSGASAITLENIKISFKKNGKMIFPVGSTTLSANENQSFEVMGDFGVTYDANTYRDLFTANTKKAVQIEIEGGTLIGATKYNKITIQLAQVHLSSWDRSDGVDDLITEQVGFTAEYSFTDTQTANVVLQNVKSSAY